MNIVEKVFAELRSLPEVELREVLDFVGYLKTRRVGALTQAANDDAAADWAEFEALAGTWSGKFRREDCYDRKVLR